MENAAPRNVRVLVANRPRLMRELILATLFDQPDIEVVGQVENDTDIPALVEQKLPDYLIVSLDKRCSRPPVCDALLFKYPNMKILALAPEENSSVFYWASLDIHSFNVESSEDGILEVLRGGSRRRAQ